MESGSASGRRHPARTGNVKSALRVVQVLDLLGQRGGARTHVQISEELNIPKSSLTQVLGTLVRHGYLAYDSETRGYSLGLAIEDLGTRARSTRELASVATPVLEWLTDMTGESSALNFREGDDHRVVATVLSPHRIVAHLKLGDRAPLHATSGGQVILAHLPPEQQDEYLGRARFERFAKNSLMDAGAARTKLERIRREGFSKVIEEFTPQIGGIARPILDSRQMPLASLSITVPVNRFTDSLGRKAMDSLSKAIVSLRRRADLT